MQVATTDAPPASADAALARLVAAVRAGDRRVLARAISSIENGVPGAAALHAALVPHTGRAHVVGITGAPGAGKSTLVNALLGEWIARGQRVAVIAVDPSSPVSGGAVLGDRVRMGEHGAHQNVFIRSLSSRGHLGGVSRTTGRIVDAFDAAGFDTIVVETVGAGQSEVEITALADTRVVVCPPGLGDDVQAIKAGILEIADLLVVNKADLLAADATVRDLKDMLRLRRDKGRAVTVLKTVATRGEGVAALVDTMAEHAARVGRGRRRRYRSVPGADAVAAVDRALQADGAVVDATPLSRTAATEILAVAAASGARDAAEVTLQDDSAATRVRVRALHASARAAIRTGMLVQAILAAAHVRGAACSVELHEGPPAEALLTLTESGATDGTAT